MDWACRTYGGKEVVHTRFWWGHLREGHYLEDPGLDGRITQGYRKRWTGFETAIT